MSAQTFPLNAIASEFRVDRHTLRRRLREAGYQTGQGKQFTIAEVADALYENRKLELEAKAARHRQQIDEAEMVRNQREVQEGRLGYVSHFRFSLTDVLTKVVQIIRQSKLSEDDQERIVAEIAAVKLDPAKLAAEGDK